MKKTHPPQIRPQQMINLSDIPSTRPKYMKGKYYPSLPIKVQYHQHSSISPTIVINNYNSSQKKPKLIYRIDQITFN